MPNYTTMTSPADKLTDILNRLQGVKQSREGYTALCPAHDDRKPSLSIKLADNETILLYCHAGCTIADICKALGIEEKDLFPTTVKPMKQKQNNKKPKTAPPPTYIYHDQDGQVLFGVIRKPGKKFAQCRPHGNGWIYGLDGIQPVPYRLPELLQALKQGKTVFIPEGEKDVDNLVANGLTATTNPMGAGKWRNDYSDYLKDADVVILPDNDEPGLRHAEQVAKSLHGKAKSIKVIELPGLAEKGDVSDWLHAGGTKEELMKLVDETPLWEPKPEVDTSNNEKLPEIYISWLEDFKKTRYVIDEYGRLCHKKTTKDNISYLEPIANFLARPTREIIRDNGLEQEMTFEVEGLLSGGIPLPRITIPAKELFSMNWIPEKWGLKPNMEPGQGSKDKMRHAIQSLSRNIKQETIYTHLGWRKVNGKWIYLHAGGAVGADGVQVDPDEDNLHRYILPDAGEVDYREVLLSILNIAPDTITVPQLALVFLAPLCEPLRMAKIEPAFVLWVRGQSGTGKSTLAALFLSFFGDFTGKSLPASFKDTANAIEKKAFAVKDSILVIDDFHPTGDKGSKQKMQQIAQQIMRGYGDRTGRARLKSDSSSRKAFRPRGLAMVTGEDIPEAGESTTARYLTVEINRGDINLDKLTHLQAETKDLGKFMRSYLEWLAPQMDDLPRKLKEKFLAYRHQARTSDQHGRLPEAVAWLQLGLETGLQYCLDKGAITTEEMAAALSESRSIFITLAKEQNRLLTGERPTEKFLTLLSEMMLAKMVKTIPLSGSQTTDDLIAKDDGFIGWHDHEFYYLKTELVWKAISSFCNQQGSQFPVSQNTLWKHLRTDRIIYADSDRPARVKKINGRPERVLFLHKKFVEQIELESAKEKPSDLIEVVI